MRFGNLFNGLVAGLVFLSGVCEATLCDTYTTALFHNNTGANQLTLLTVLVNTVIIGNYTNNVTVPGILAPGVVNGVTVSLTKYFSGAGATSNVNGAAGTVNFLDGGGAAPLAMSMPSTSALASSRQNALLNHLYQYFGYLIGCTAAGFPAYTGQTSMYTVHKFMGLSNEEITYFISQVGAAAVSLGVSTADATAVGGVLAQTFGYKCTPAASIPSTAAAQLQSICTGADCVADPAAACSLYTSGAFSNGPSVALLAMAMLSTVFMI